MQVAPSVSYSFFSHMIECSRNWSLSGDVKISPLICNRLSNLDAQCVGKVWWLFLNQYGIVISMIEMRWYKNILGINVDLCFLLENLSIGMVLFFKIQINPFRWLIVDKLMMYARMVNRLWVAPSVTWLSVALMQATRSFVKRTFNWVMMRVGYCVPLWIVCWQGLST